MDSKGFNKTFLKAISDYESSKKDENGILYNSFLVTVIRTLVLIYSELDIVNPVVTENIDALYDNLTKFGYKKEFVESFLNNLNKFEVDKNNNKVYFISIEKELVDMFICKKINFHVSEKETKEFLDLLYTSNSSSPLRISYNYLMSSDPDEIKSYFETKMKNNIKTPKVEEKTILNIKAYEYLNYSYEDIVKMSKEKLDKVNHQVYDYFKIRENAINKEYLLDKAIEELEKEGNKLTTGNGYVDILLIMGGICTAIMVICILTFIVF